ncbi:hypothetical protein DY124_06660 [Apilactobacillus micheneri]|uniref:hypothetical protein n=1 Tax=Apilactobacillus micheneri TaxID=1899430 RepID=UPI00112B1DC6|nr:hypothetical protein [Apilactobacillus micheneri]TPR42955.1 hypothetical protein DY124_06660 [Apilactobacillus micheneri]TPR47286.1 hypothetical protein DY125_06340 [Apilactobacillus micheneri]
MKTNWGLFISTILLIYLPVALILYTIFLVQNAGLQIAIYFIYIILLQSFSSLLSKKFPKIKLFYKLNYGNYYSLSKRNKKVKKLAYTIALSITVIVLIILFFNNWHGVLFAAANSFILIEFFVKFIQCTKFNFEN